MASISTARRAGLGLLSHEIGLDTVPASGANRLALGKKIEELENVHSCEVRGDGSKKLIVKLPDTLTVEEHRKVLTAVRDLLHDRECLDSCIRLPRNLR